MEGHQGAAPFSVSGESATDQLIRLLRDKGVTVQDMRGKLPLRPGTTPPAYPNRTGGLASLRWLVVHHTGAGSARPTVHATAAYQIGPGTIDAFPGIAYVLYIEADGTLCVCWDLEAETWSQGIGSPYQDANGLGVNNEWGLALCFSGGDPTDAQWTTITHVSEAVNQVVGRPLTLTGHRLVDPGTTECPGDVAAARLQKP